MLRHQQDHWDLLLRFIPSLIALSLNGFNLPLITDSENIS